MSRTPCSPYVFLALLPLCIPLTACGEDTSAPAAAGGASSTGGAAGARAGSAGTSAIGGAGGGAGQSQGGTAGSAQGGTAGSAPGGTAGSAQGGTAGSAQGGTAGSAQGGTAGSAQGGTNGTAGESNGGGAAGSTGGAGGKGGAAGEGAAGNVASAGQGGGGGEVPPTTCNEARGTLGCCSADRKTIYYFDNGEVVSRACNALICTWIPGEGGYECAANDAGADPSGEYPLACNTPLGFVADGCADAPVDPVDPIACPTGDECSATPAHPVCDAATKTCSATAQGACDAIHGNAGCCSADGKTAYFWDGFRVVGTMCGDEQACSWTGDFYECAAGPAYPDPFGVFPLLCTEPVDPTKTGCEVL